MNETAKKCSHCRCTLGSNGLVCWWCSQAARETEADKQVDHWFEISFVSLADLRRWFAQKREVHGAIL